ncbi:MAG: zinc-ribbon domain-containing protein [Oscillospiraceae bacterium]|nr:zinc-ribbon domain-containing protein [Oscillospiraceae bacterium]
MYCPNCRNPVAETARFCPTCGTPFAPAGYAPPPAQIHAGTGAVRQGIPAPGFSDRVQHPEILAAVKKNRKAAGIAAFFIVPLPLLGFVIYSLVSDQMETAEAVKIGAIVSAVFLVFALFSFIKERAVNTYEAVVIDKRTSETYRHGNSDDRGMVTEYITVVQTTEGKRKKITEHDGSQVIAFHYLNIGDRFRCHPQFHFPYERCDKANAPYLGCVSCGKRNPVEADRCRKCNLPLLK